MCPSSIWSISSELSQAATGNSHQKIQNIIVAPPSPAPIPDNQSLLIVAPTCQLAPEAPKSEREAQWLVEIACLCSLLDLNASAANHPSVPSERVLFNSPQNVDQIRSAIIASKDIKKKIVVPKVIPEFKAALTDFSSLRLFIIYLFIILDMVIDLSCLFILKAVPPHQLLIYWFCPPPSSHVVSIPPKVKDAFCLFHYVPYMALSHNACLRAAQGENDFMINSQGGLTAKGLDHHNETSINTFDWIAASHVVEKWMDFHHGGVRANALVKHHAMILKLACSHTWEIMMDYDIQQQELVSVHPTHDISMLDLMALTLIAT